MRAVNGGPGKLRVLSGADQEPQSLSACSKLPPEVVGSMRLCRALQGVVL